MIWTELAEMSDVMSDGPPATPPAGQEKRKQKGESGSVKKKLKLARAAKQAKQVADKKAATSAEKEYDVMYQSEEAAQRGVGERPVADP